MAASLEHAIIITDASVLINFLAVDRTSLFTALKGRRFLVTDHVRDEVTAHYPEQLERLKLALASQEIEEISVTDPAEVQLFAELTLTGLGVGECSAIAVAAHRNCSLAIDDKTARKRVAERHPELPVLTTESLVILMIREGVLTVADADAMKGDWETHHRFRLPFGSFGERI